MEDPFESQVYMGEQPAGETPAAEPETVQGFAPKVAGEKVSFSSGFAGGVAANQDATVNRAGAFGIAVGRDMELSQGGSFAMAVGRDLKLANGGAFVMPVGNTAEVTNGGAMVLLGGGQVTARNSFFGIVFSSMTTLEEGSRVLLDTKQAFAFGAALGTTLAVLGWLFNRKR